MKDDFRTIVNITPQKFNLKLKSRKLIYLFNLSSVHEAGNLFLYMTNAKEAISG